jgi:hypothetical protein
MNAVETLLVWNIDNDEQARQPIHVAAIPLGPEKYELGPYPTPEVAMPGRYRFL